MTSLNRDADPGVEEAPRTILIVEDDILIRRAITDRPRDRAYTDDEAGNVAEAQTGFLAALLVDVACSPVQRSGALGGRDMARWICAHHPDAPEILTSGVACLVADASDLCQQAGFVENPITALSSRAYDRCFRGG